MGIALPAAQAVAPVLLNLCEEQAPSSDKFTIHISYLGIMRFSGLSSPNAVRSALVELRDWGLLRFPDDGTVSRGPERPTATYTITPNSDELWELCQVVARQTQEEIAAEKELRARLKKERIHLLRGKRSRRRQCTKYKSLYSTHSAHQKSTIPGIATN